MKYGVAFLLFMIPLASFANNTGNVHGVIFEDENQIPIKNISIFSKAEPEAVAEIHDGIFEISLSEGTHELIVYLGEGIVASLGEVDVVAGYSIEVVGSVSKEGEVTSFHVEGIEREQVQKEVVDENLPISSILGVVLHEETKEPVEGVRVFIRGVKGQQITDKQGRFHFDVPVGVYDISALHQQFATMTKNNVSVVENRPAEVELLATPMGVTLSDYVVTAPRIEGGTASLMEERKESTAVEDIIGAEQMSKTGDSNAASALKRVTGITVVGGKYVYVRGLGERYSSTLFNGAMLPSPEPERRVIPLDMFPAGMLESVVVQKSYSPEMPGEFGGGVVQLRSRNYPTEFVFDVTFSAELVTGTTFTNGWRSVRGPTDWLGVDGGFRDLPSDFVNDTNEKALVEGNRFTNPDGFTSEQLEALGEMIPKQWKRWKKTVPPNMGGSLTVGNTFKLKKIKLGVVASGMYDNEWDNLEKDVTIYNIGDDELSVFHDYDFFSTTNTIKAAAFLALGIEFSKNHKLRSTTILTRISDNMTREYRGFNKDLGGDIKVSRQRFVERQLFSQQIVGEHVIEALKDFGIDYRYTFSKATRDEPLRRDARYDLEDEATNKWVLSDRPEGNQIFYSLLDDVTHDLGLTLSMPFEFNKDNNMKLFSGVSFLTREREVDVRRFKFYTKRTDSFPGSGGPLTYDPEDLFTDEFIGPYTFDGGEYLGLQIKEVTQPTDNYRATQDIVAGYGKAEFELNHGVKLMGGARVEKSVQQVDTFELFTAEPQIISADLETLDVLPAGTVSWEFKKGMMIRGGYGRTVSRPEFRELSEARFYDVTGGRETYGNPDLKRAIIDNFDLRFDWFFSPGELLSFGGFLKQFENPIETSLIPAAQVAMSWKNAKSARNLGVEFDVRKSFDWISDSLADFYFAGNASLIYSRVELDEEGIQTSDERALQGQSPYVFNAQLGYDNVDTDMSIVMLYNVFGKRISEVGARGMPDTYEQPFHQFNFIIKKKFYEKLGASFKVTNILNQSVHFTQGGNTTLHYNPGVSFSFGLSYSH